MIPAHNHSIYELLPANTNQKPIPDKYASGECPRCGREFTCKAGTPCLCACFSLRLTPSEIRFIEDTCERECVCEQCLLDLQLEFQTLQ